jgi:hypothetical protein
MNWSTIGLLALVLSPIVFVSTHVAHMPFADYALAGGAALLGVVALGSVRRIARRT